ncbi:[Pyruvate dehydrogenase (acetyl-transferring)] kinase isozyme 2 [Dimargaris xerosporica]|nr:[Pyruvate dehydrogenase (acetyl-transferring)] kinase isozyme 2 [Dimargaris xerosporica]
MPTPSRLLQAIPKDPWEVIAKAKFTKLSLDHIYSFARYAEAPRHRATALTMSAQFLHRELPVRLYQNLKLLQSPRWQRLILASPALQRLGDRYAKDIQLLTTLDVPIPSTSVAQLHATLKILCRRTQHHVELARLGLTEASTALQSSTTSADGRTTTPPRHLYPWNVLHHRSLRVDQFFEHLYTLNLANQFLISEQIALADCGSNLVTDVQPIQVAQRTIDKVQRTARDLLASHGIHGVAPPEIHLLAPPTLNATLYIEPCLHNILFTILLNAVTATINHHHRHQVHAKTTGTGISAKAASSYPAVTLTVVEGTEDVSFKVSDEGGGMSLSKMQDVWRHTCQANLAGPSLQVSVNPTLPPTPTSRHQPSLPAAVELPRCPLFGEPLNLPTARLMTRYFGGDINHVSMEGRGTDTYLHILRRKCFMETVPDTTLMAWEPTKSQYPPADEILFPLQQSTELTF